MISRQTDYFHQNAYCAGRVAEFQREAQYEAFSVPITLFNTKKTMIGGTKSILVKLLSQISNVKIIETLPA